MRIRPETESDQAAIRAVITQAFKRPEEADLVDALRTAGDLAVSLVAAEAGEICGHVALSRLKSPERALALAPVAVATAAQGYGTGTALVREAIGHARKQGHGIVFVVGEPRFYGRFGFSPDIAANFQSRFAGPHFLALNLSEQLPRPAPVICAGAFDALE